MPEPDTTLSVILLPFAGQTLVWMPGFGAITIPVRTWSRTRFFVTRSSTPPITPMPTPYAVSNSAVGECAAFRLWCRVHEVAGEHAVALGRELLAVEGVGHDARAVESPRRVDDEQVAARVGTRVAELVVLRDRVGDHGVARVALADVEARVGAAGRVVVVELAVLASRTRRCRSRRCGTRSGTSRDIPGRRSRRTRCPRSCAPVMFSTATPSAPTTLMPLSPWNPPSRIVVLRSTPRITICGRVTVTASL